jgi:putative zinc finger protein
MFDGKKSDIHAWVEERLSGYIDNQIAPDERARIDAHLAECTRCRASLDSLRWTVSLLKQAPAPAMARSFTIPVTRKEAKVSRVSFGLLRGATALAMLLLCLVVGLDLYSQQSRLGGASAPALAPASQFAAPTQNIALAPTVAPTSAPPPAPPAAPTVAPPALPPAAPLVAPSETRAPRVLSQPVGLATATRPLSAGAAEVQATQAQAQDALKSQAAAPTAPPGARDGITVTLASSSPAPTQPVASATQTPIAAARTEPTRALAPRADGSTVREEFPAIRTIELGLLGIALALGVVTVAAWRRR